MRVEPKSEKEIQEMNLRDPGEFDFLVDAAEEKRSQKGNDMVELKLKMEDGQGRTFFLYDYLVSTDAMAFKLRHFAKSVGMLTEYEKGEMEAMHMEGRTGKCKVGTQPAKNGYPAKNIVTDYLFADGEEVPAKQLQDDEIPF